MSEYVGEWPQRGDEAPGDGYQRGVRSHMRSIPVDRDSHKINNSCGDAAAARGDMKTS